jgi:DNA-binding protein H-NS
MKLQDIKKFVRENDLPDSLKLNQCTNILNLNTFFESHIASMESPNNNKHIKMIHYERVMKAIKLLQKLKGAMITPMAEKHSNLTQKITPPPSEKQNESKSTNNNDMDFYVIENIKIKSGIKPNTDFEEKISTPPEYLSTPPKKESVKQNNDSESQMTLF